eukprot:1160146-Pelagomonas_calceolata.AAC.25
MSSRVSMLLHLVGPAGITDTTGRAELPAIVAAFALEYTRCHGQPQLTSPTQKANPVSREAQAPCTRRGWHTAVAAVARLQLPASYY